MITPPPTPNKPETRPAGESEDERLPIYLAARHTRGANQQLLPITLSPSPQLSAAGDCQECSSHDSLRVAARSRGQRSRPTVQSIATLAAATCGVGGQARDGDVTSVALGEIREISGFGDCCSNNYRTGRDLSMSGWNENIIEEFRANDGMVGGTFEGTPLLLLHHLGPPAPEQSASVHSSTRRLTMVTRFLHPRVAPTPTPIGITTSWPTPKPRSKSETTG